MGEKDFNIKEESVEKLTRFDIERSLKTFSEEDWRVANWPVVTFVPKELTSLVYEGGKDANPFWKQAFNPKNFIYPNSRVPYDSKKHSLYVLHSFSTPDEKDVVFRAITTNPNSLLGKNARFMINYKFHGKPCESSSREAYPTCSNFWEDFYDKLSESQQSEYPMPSSSWRKEFILRKYFGKVPSRA